MKKKIGVLYFKFFLFAGVPYGVMMTLLNSLISHGNGREVLKGMIAGGLFGLVMSLILVTVHIIKVNDIEDRYILTKYDVKQRGSVTLDYNIEDAKVYVKSVLEDRRLSVVEEHGRKIVYKSSFSLKSFGEIIDINLTDLNDSKVKVDICSRPKGWGTLVDNGRNLENVLVIKEALA